MSEENVVGRVRRRLRRLPYVVNLKQVSTRGVTQLLDFDVGFPEGSMRAEDGREAEILSSTIYLSHGTVDDFLFRLPPVRADLYGEDELHRIVSDAVDDADIEASVEINPDAPDVSEWTPHVIAREWPPYRDAGAVVDLLDTVYKQYREAVFDPDKTTFGAPDRASTADLFHITRPLDATSIAENGLLRGSMNRTEKIARDAAGEVGQYDDDPDANPFMMEEPADVQADRRFDELMADAGRAVDRSLPSHRSEDAVFFWAEERNAIRAAKNRGGANEVVVAVDSRKLPDGCEIVKGDISVTDSVYTRIREATSKTASRPLSRDEEEELFEQAKEYWRDVIPYEYGDGDEPFMKAEVWANCDVPPRAIEAIYDPETERVLYDPAEADQRTLREFEAARR